jgi:hypothetical protein
MLLNVIQSGAETLMAINSRSRPVFIAVALLTVALAACSLPSDKSGVSAPIVVKNADTSGTDPDGGGGEGAWNDGGDVGGALTEMCDGFDNDADGQVDEDLSPQPCTISGKLGSGLSKCVSGHLLCTQCNPGEIKTTACGCNQNRTDTCLGDGTWSLGTCDGCESTKKPCELCVPGERIVRRCDGCPDGGDCGTTCIGSIWECATGCKWEQITSCTPMTPTCSGDMSVLEKCGTCGTRRKACDGCFWTGDLCMEQGECKPGENKQTPCFSKGCAEGTVAQTYCGTDCRWTKPTSCQGCEPGVTVIKQNCVRDHPECGQSELEQTCTLKSEIAICGGEKKLPVGQATYRSLKQCSYTLCAPGSSQTQPCVMGDGTAGTRKVNCSASCAWEPPTECTPGGTVCPTSQTCTPSAVTTQQKSCGANTCGKMFEETKTCTTSGCGFQTKSTQSTACPECAGGQTKQLSCKTTSGACGTLTVKCDSATCSWESAPAAGSTTDKCVASASSCTPGDTKTEYQSCGDNTCGQKFPRKFKCVSTGCGWQFESEDRSVCPSCKPGVTEATSQLCSERSPACGNVQRVCNADTCQWQTLPCPPCG